MFLKKARRFYLPYITIILCFSAVAFFFFLFSKSREGHRIHPNSFVSEQGDCDFDCVRNRMVTLLQARGVKEAQSFLYTLFQEQRISENECHMLAHMLGRSAFDMFRDTDSALELAMPFCAGAYSHGVLEGSFVSRFRHSVIRAEDVRETCEAYLRAGDRMKSINCLHGLGHGIVRATDYNLIKSLELCDSYSQQWQRDRCYDGVFMETVYAVPESDNRPVLNPYLKEDDPFYLCNLLTKEQYFFHCYWRVLPAHLFITGNLTPETAARVAETVPEKYKKAYWFGMGRFAGISVAGDMERIKILCKAFPEKGRIGCISGAARHSTVASTNPENGELLCKSLPSKEDIQTCVGFLDVLLDYRAIIEDQ